MIIIVIAGSNIDPDIHIVSGLKRLKKIARVIGVSSAYLSRPSDRPEQSTFINAAICLEIPDTLSRITLRHKLRDIEAHEGRIRTSDTHAARTLDLDVVIYGTNFVDYPALEHAFVAIPVMELLPLIDHEIAIKAEDIKSLEKNELISKSMRLEVD